MGDFRRRIAHRVIVLSLPLVSVTGCGTSPTGGHGGQTTSFGVADADARADAASHAGGGSSASSQAPTDASRSAVSSAIDANAASASDAIGRPADQGGPALASDAADSFDEGTILDEANADSPPVPESGTHPGEGGADAAPPGDAATVGCGDVRGGGPVKTLPTHLDIGVHDPSMIWDGRRYYLLATGGTLGIRSSPDMFTWSSAGSVLTAVPAWITAAIGKTPGDLWAPDISSFNGQFHVYYAGSTFGSTDSVIGLATNTTLEPGAPGYAWIDRGLVLASRTGDTFNAIDPNVVFDQSCNAWLAYGSFGSGIKLRKLDAMTGKLAADDTTAYALASRGGGAIEGASIVGHNGFYYLFVSFGNCCQGVASTYKTMVGRATTITGPYTNKAGSGMMAGAAEPLLATSGRYIGPGGGTAWKDGDTYLYVFHYYDGQGNGAPKMQVRPIQFGADDWITLGPPLFP